MSCLCCIVTMPEANAAPNLDVLPDAPQWEDGVQFVRPGGPTEMQAKLLRWYILLVVTMRVGTVMWPQLQFLLML